MSDQLLDIIFRGDIVLGHQLVDVKARLQQLFKADAAKVDALFSGRPVPLKRGLDLISAQKYKDALMKAGAHVDIVPTGETRSVTATPAPPLTLAQRLEQQEAAAKAQAERDQAEAALTQAAASEQKSTWSLAPVGAYLLQPAEKTYSVPIEIDTSAISLREQGGNILDANEQIVAPIAMVEAPDFEVAEVGSDLITAEEKTDLPLLDIELAEWTLADLGEDLIAGDEKILTAVPTIKIPDVELAPIGSDLGQLKPQIKTVIPDVSGLSLAE